MQSDNIQKYRIVAISNPRSGRNKRGGFEKFKKTLVDYPAIDHIVTTNQAELIVALEKCKQFASNIIIVNGGDGTLLHILTYLKKTENKTYNPELVLLKAGTTSMAYGDVGCKGKLTTVLAKILAYARGDLQQFKHTERSIIRMTIPKKSQVACGMFFGGGAIYNGILYCRQKIHTKGVRGEIGPSVAMIRYILDWLTVNKMTTSTRAHIKADDVNIIEGDFTIISTTTLKRLLMGVYPFWGNATAKSNLFLTLIKRNAPKPTKAFMKIMSGNKPGVELEENYYRSLCASKVALDIYDGFTLDGELYGEPGCLTQVILESAGEVTFLTK